MSIPPCLRAACPAFCGGQCDGSARHEAAGCWATMPSPENIRAMEAEIALLWGVQRDDPEALMGEMRGRVTREDPEAWLQNEGQRPSGPPARGGLPEGRWFVNARCPDGSIRALHVPGPGRWYLLVSP